MPLGKEVGLGPGDIVLDGDPDPPDATWYGGMPHTRRHCVGWGPAPPPKKGGMGSNFWPMCIVAMRSPISATAEIL